MQRLPRLGAGFVLFVYLIALSSGLVGAAAADPLPTIAAPGGGACAVLKDVPDLPGLWLGHFAGGRFLRVDAVRLLDWRDQYSCFPSRAACGRWQRHLRHVYRQVEGYKTCLPLR